MMVKSRPALPLGLTQPLLPAAEFLEISQKAQHFQQFEGRRVQRFLELRSWTGLERTEPP